MKKIFNIIIKNKLNLAKTNYKEEHAFLYSYKSNKIFVMIFSIQEQLLLLFFYDDLKNC